jgi:hypothetical protein
MSGTIASYTTGIIPTTTFQTTIGGTLPMTSSLTNLRVTTGSGAAQIYNNNAFTPSTSPLFPASNVTGGSLTTRLLVRVPLSPNKMVVPKLGGANCNTVLAFPPAPMTGYATNMTGLSYYGQGVYVASASSEYSGYNAYNAFYGSWVSAASYSSATPGTSTATTTVDISGNSYQGEWIQVQMPTSIVLTSYSFSGNSQQGPYRWFVLGSSDGTNWSLVDQRSNASNYSPTVSSSQAFSYFRMVINQVQNLTTALPLVVSIGSLRFNGTIESVNVTPDGRVGLGVVNPTRALEVAGDIVCSGTVSGGNPTMFKNRIINGNFDIWQRGTSFTNQAPGTYTTDRFCNNWDGTGATRTISRQSFTPGQTDVPGNPLYFYRFAQTVAGSGGLYNNCLIQHIEGVQTFAGQPIVVSFWARAFVGTVFIMSAMRQVFGTSGSADVDFSPTSQQTYVLTSNWQRYTFQYFVPSINGKTIGTAGDYLALYNYVNVNLIETIDITGVQLEKGTVATPFEVRPFATELALCQRYYETSYGPQTTPGTASQYQNFAIVKAISTSVVRGQVPFRISKRGNFNVGLASGSIYSYAGTLNRISNMGTGLTDVVLTTPTLSFFTSGWISIVDSATPFTVGETYIAGWAASAEL